MSWGLTSAGLSLPRHEDLLAEIDARYFADTGIDLDSANPDNANQLLVRLNGYHVDQLMKVLDLVQAVYDAFDPDGAEGVQASHIARITGTERKQPTKSTVTCRCSGTNGTVLLEGATAQGGTSDELARWVATESGTISGGFVDLVFEAAEAGATTAEAGTIDTIVTPVSGWTSVTNLADAAVGLDEETDAALLKRRRLALAERAGCGHPGIRSRLLGLDFVQAAAILSNGDSEEKELNGITMPGNSYLVVLLPTQLTEDQEKEVLSVLYDSVLSTSQPAGTDVEGTVVEFETGVSWPVAFDYGTDLEVTIAFTITTVTGASESDARAALKAKVAALWPLGLSEGITRLQLLGLADDTGIVQTASVLIQGVDADFVPAFTERIVGAVVTVNGVVA